MDNNSKKRISVRLSERELKSLERLSDNLEGYDNKSEVIRFCINTIDSQIENGYFSIYLDFLEAVDKQRRTTERYVVQELTKVKEQE